MDGDDGMDSDEEMEEMGGGAMKANVAFLLTAISGAVFNGLWLGRYGTAGMNATIGDTASSTNYYQLADYLAHGPALLLHVVLSITQLLSMLGIAVEVNMMAWHVAGMVHMVVGTLYFFLYLFAYNTYEDVEENGTAAQ